MTDGSESSPTDWALLRKVDNEAEAEMITGLLESHGIACKVLSKRFQQEPVNFGLLGSVEIHVDASEAQRASTLLDEAPLAEEVWELSEDE